MGSAVLTNAVATTVSASAPTTNLDAKTGLGTRTGGAGDALGYIYWPRPFPLRATILSAKIIFYTTIYSTAGSLTYTFTRLAQSFSASKVTYNTRPTAMQAGTKTITKTGPLPSGQEWQLDVTDWMQSISNGGAWYGVRFQVTAPTAVAHYWYAENHPTVTLRPRLEVTWSDAPATPTGLSPSGGRRVGTPRPIVRATYLDVSGATALQAVNVQANATDVWTAPTFDSGTVLTSVPDLDLSLTSFSALADGASTFWRIRFQDAAGLWSPWSASTSFTYDNQGTLVLNSPDVDPGVVTNTNFVGNGKVATALTGWTAGFSGTGDTGTQSRVATGGPTVDIPSFTRLTFTATGTGTTGGIQYNGTGSSGAWELGTMIGDSRSAGVWVRCSKAQRLTLYVQYVNDASVTQLSTNNTPTVVTANAWTWLSWSNPSLAPTGTTKARLLVYSISGTGALGWTSGDTLDVSGLIMTPGTTAPASYFDGDTPAAGGFTYGWTGAANASRSEQYDPPPPAALKVEDATPPIIWTFTGETQAAYQVYIQHTANGAVITDWNSGKVSASTTTVTVPAGAINEPDGTVYTVTVRVWDNKQREATPGVPVYSEAVGAFTYKPHMAISPVILLTATTADPEPVVVLEWNRGVSPDRFNVLRNGHVIAAGLIPSETLRDDGLKFTYTDNAPSPQRALTYSVQSVVNNRASSLNPTATVTVRSKGIWLREPVSGLKVCLVGKDDRSFTLGETSAALQSIAPNANKVAINQSLGGLEGRVEGDLQSVYSRTAQQWRDDFLKLRALRVKRFYLTVGDYTFQVVAQNFSYQVKTVPVPAFHVGFDFYQQDSISTAYLGS